MKRLTANIHLARAILVIVTVFLMFYSVVAGAQTKRSRCYSAMEMFFGVRGYTIESNIDASNNLTVKKGGHGGVTEKTFYLTKPKKIKKKFIESFKPYSGYTSANGFSFKNDDKALCYLTNIDWNFNRGKEVVQLWNIGFQLAENLNSKFLQSGFYSRNKRHSSPVYYMNVIIDIEQRKSFATLTFSEHNGKMLYTLFISEEPNLDKRLEKLSSEEMLAKN